ncbi:MAG: putative Rossmann-fold nucleotide-binding protein [Kiritimatiellia bacterium]|jgi:predicted Rossmann-fold nucleotide-binding protein
MRAIGNIIEVESLAEFTALQGQLINIAVQGLDLSKTVIDPDELTIENAWFLGCTFSSHERVSQLRAAGAMIFPGFEDLPYQPYRSSLYTVDELMEGYDPEDDQSVDRKIYDHFVHHKNAGTDIIEALAQRLHDHSIDNALHALLEGRHDAGGRKKPVGIMGGHGTRRTDPFFNIVSRIARQLTRDGKYVVTGGGPGIMEAGNLGAWLAPYPDEALDEALTLLAKSPHYTSPGYLDAARRVVEHFPDGAGSLAIPTWFYGHEPSNLFATDIAKYFSNSLREDGLLAIAIYGVIYAPGSAGTLQEVFMDLCQNHYRTFKYTSPMVFLGKEYYRDETMLYPLLQKFAEGRDYEPYLAISDDAEEIVEFIHDHPPVRLDLA